MNLSTNPLPVFCIRNRTTKEVVTANCGGLASVFYCKEVAEAYRIKELHQPWRYIVVRADLMFGLKKER
jgi:hypothetical protein